MSRYDAVDGYVYPGTSVLRNKADIRDQLALDAFEADATAVRMLELLEKPLVGQFDFVHLCSIHHHLFQDVYEWAGLIRTVDISREGSRFAHVPMIEGYLRGELGRLPSENWLRGLGPAVFVKRLAHYMGEINAAHPFRDGNGRTQRVFCSLLAEQAGYFIDFESVDQARMYGVMVASFKGNAEPLETLLMATTSIIDSTEARDDELP